MTDWLPAGQETVEGVRKYFFNVSKGGLTHFLINPNGHNTAYASKVWDSVWHEDPRLKSSKHMKQFENSRVLHENGVDWIQVMVDCCREQGVSPWISMRMNDIHHIGDLYQFSNSRFWLDHPEYRRTPHKAPGNSFDSELAYDFTHKGVRDHALALVREMLEKWDVDGFEFDWLRFPHHVNGAAERDFSGCAALTEFMREAKKIVDEVGRKRSKRLLVCVRVASMPEAARGLGTDAVQWAKEGLVDWVAPCNFWATTDFALPYSEWKRLLAAANPKVRLVGAFDFAGVARENQWGPQGVTEAEFAGYLERMHAAGVTDFEAFNRFLYSETPVNRLVQIDGLRDGEKWARTRERAYAVTYHDAVPSGYSEDQRLPFRFDQSRELVISVGRIGAASTVALLLAFEGPVPADLAKAVSLNGVRPVSITETKPADWMPNIRKVTHSCRVAFPLSAAKDGVNVVRLSPLAGASQLDTCELAIGPDSE